MNLTKLDYNNLFGILKYTKKAYNNFEKILEQNENQNIANVLVKLLDDLKKQYNGIYNLFEKNKDAKEMLILDACCKNCHNNLLVSDNIDYTYQCEQCDENFYAFESESFDDDSWFDDEEESIELGSSFNINVDYDNDLKTVWIDDENGSGVEYKCNSMKDLKNSIQTYYSNYLDYEKEMEGKN